MSLRSMVAWATLVSACSPGVDETPVVDERPTRALVIGVDGLRPDGLAAADTPNLDAWFDQGRITLTASTQRTGDTVSGPGWASILTGVEVERHGVTSNDDLASRSADTPTFLATARGSGRQASASVHWVGIVLLLGDDSTDALALGDDAGVGAQLTPWVEDPSRDVIFSHFDDVDHAGHATGFSASNQDYLAAIEAVDDAVGPALTAVGQRAATERWLVALVTDHGGLGTGHSGAVPETQTIPMAMSADGGVLVVPDDPTHMDVAPTVLSWFGAPVGTTDGASWWSPDPS